MIWSGMIALATVAAVIPDFIFTHRAEILASMDSGSVITMDNGVAALAYTAAAKAPYNKTIIPVLLNHLKTCRPKDLAQHAEKILPAVNLSNRSQFAAVLTRRTQAVSGSALGRVKKVLKQAEEI